MTRYGRNHNLVQNHEHLFHKDKRFTSCLTPCNGRIFDRNLPNPVGGGGGWGGASDVFNQSARGKTLTEDSVMVVVVVSYPNTGL